jgi:ABC-2 type transport system ATP-binding protein
MVEGIALEAIGVAKRYGRTVLALENIDLRIRAGSVTALVGPNGAGKSTLIKAWVGFERPTHGQVTVGGVDPFRHRKSALERIGYVPQSSSLYRELTVANHLDLVQSMRPTFDRGHATHRLNQLRIPLGRRAGELSGGQQAQVTLALALGTRAEVLLLDEPLASLDPLARREFLHVLTDAVANGGRTALLSSHIVTDIEEACDHLVVLVAGQKLLDEPITEAIAGHRIVAGGTGIPGGIGSFFDARGGQLTLVNAAGSDGTDRRPATLEEVVLGYLAAARSLAEAEGQAAA